MLNVAATRSRNRLGIRPFGKYSFGWIMRAIKAHELVEMGFEAGASVRGADAVEGVTWDDRQHLVDGYMAISAMESFYDIIGAHNLRDMMRQFAELAESDDSIRPSADEVIVHLETSFKRELERCVFVHIPTERAYYYENDEFLSGSLKQAFPNACQEMRSAANAYSCGLSVATVFHCMRALEYGLAAVVKDVGLTWTKEQWHTIIEAVESKIEGERRTLRKGSARDERLHFLSTAAKEFFYFKDGWRNHVAHNRVHYEAPQALGVLEHTVAFFEHISKALNEQTS